MSALKIIAYIAAAILIFFGVIFIYAAFDPDTSDSWILGGLISVAIGFGLIWLGSRQQVTPSGQQTDVTLNVDLPANVDLDKLKCQQCGGALHTEDIKMIAGAPVVSCPYCDTTYQLTEDPKW